MVRVDLIIALGTPVYKMLWLIHGQSLCSIFFLFLLQNGSRRRTPGGVFLNLLKNTPSISEEQIKVKIKTFLTLKIQNNLTSTQPLASFSTNLHHLLCLKLTSFVIGSFEVKLGPFVKLCLLLYFPFRAKIKISFYGNFSCFLCT